ncbi:ABC transporter permease [Rhodococcus sp. 14-2483-1-2]|uniref:ABC transporter permease n=1 Tax=Rhodococcus sp. 14-2483-1-2 TaxID=2023147 RepID=UPI00207B4A26|nr:ABC transporter permease [Rhodococcus sp. 14-2483-1-2]
MSTSTSVHPSTVGDTLWLAGRHLRLMSRRPASIVGALVLPLIFTLLFYAVFRIPMERLGIDYAQYLLPAVVIQAMFFSAMSASVWAAEDAAGGMVNRLRSMPVARSAPVLSLLVGELVRSLISIVVLLLAGYGLGFRFENGVLTAALFFLLALSFGAATSLLYLAIGYAIAKADTAQSVGGLLYYPLLLLSNCFVPTSAYPDWLEPVVEQQPVTRVADGLRALSTAGTAGATSTVLIAFAWCAALVMVGGYAGSRAFGRIR